MLFVAGAAACIPDPKGEFEDYKERTANLGPKDEVVDASIDSKPPETAQEALYVGICTTILANKDPEQALRFYTKSKYVPNGPESGTLTLTVKPMVGWDTAKSDYIKPASVSASETRGNEKLVENIPVTGAQSRFTAQLGTMELPPEANSVTGRPVQIDNATLDGRFGETQFCAKLGGKLVKPYEANFVPDENICLFIKVKEGDPLPEKKGAEFVCPF